MPGGKYEMTAKALRPPGTSCALSGPRVCGHRTSIPMAESAAHKPTVHVDAGAEGRVMVADSLSFFEHEPWLNDVAVGASFAGAPTAAMAMRQGVKAWIAHEAGPGKDEAGVSGLPFADRYGVPAAAIATMEAR